MVRKQEAVEGKRDSLDDAGPLSPVPATDYIVPAWDFDSTRSNTSPCWSLSCLVFLPVDSAGLVMQLRDFTPGLCPGVHGTVPTLLDITSDRPPASSGRQEPRPMVALHLVRGGCVGSRAMRGLRDDLYIVPTFRHFPRVKCIFPLEVQCLRFKFGTGKRR